MNTDSFPPYSYVPGGLFPHPNSNPSGHSFGKQVGRIANPAEILPSEWSTCRPYVFGLDLFNHGYYWEAHEAWEGLWHACGRQGTTAAFMKGLIQLAVAGVKVREGKPAGVTAHVRRGAELFREVLSHLPAGQTTFMGLDLVTLIDHAKEIEEQPPQVDEETRSLPVMVVFPFTLS